VSFGVAVALCAAAYLGLLFAIAYWGDQRAARRGISDSGVVYALSIAVYCTSWTFYGSVGRAAERGIDFLPIYLGPTLVFCLGWLLLRKILHVAKANRITSIADLIASRYGKSALLAGLVTVIAVVGTVPYIALQLKATSTTFALMWSYPDPAPGRPPTLLADTAFWVAALMACFAILFGTRHIDASERHHGMVVAIAFESLVKLMAFAAVGIFVTFVLFDGFGDLFAKAARDPEFERLAGLAGAEAGINWTVLMLLSMAAIICLPRQFQVTIVENLSERHLDRAMWLFPLYLLAINLFVLPIAWTGRLTVGPGADTDLYVLSVPLQFDARWLATVAFLGGLSAATSMVIVECVAVGTMVCNDLVLPILLRFRRFAERTGVELVPTLLFIRRATIVILLALGYLYMRTVGDSYALVSIGLVSFAAVAQFAPAILAGLFWRRANRIGALLGIGGGTLVWLYTLLLPSFARSGLLPIELIELGPMGITWLKPYALFGLKGLDTITHSLFWSMLANIGGIVAGSILFSQSPMERAQAAAFVDADREGATLRRASAPVAELEALLGRFIGRDRAQLIFRAHAGRPDAVARGRDRLVLGAARGRLDRQGGAARARRHLPAARCDLAGTRVLAPPGGGDRRADPRQCAAAGARPAEGRLPVDREPRATHAADLDPLLLRDPA
jgi:Na+/proline symporter